MSNKKKKLFLGLSLCVLLLFGTVIVSTAATMLTNSTTTNSVKVHFKSEWEDPNVYYFNSLPNNISTEWPGVAMTSDGNGWYSYEFKNVNKINFIFNKDGNQTEDLTRNSGEWWYKDGNWTDSDPDATKQEEPTEPTNPTDPIVPGTKGNGKDFREDTIYFVVTTRFFDGYKENNVHCDGDKNAGNPDSDPAWRGDFAGLIQKLDYIKALGFSAVWITPVVENASGLDYHGYHAINFSKVDPRLESTGATYQDLINVAHSKGIKIIQDIVLNHTSNNGEENLFPIMTKQNSLTGGVGSNSSKVVKNDVNGVLPANYDSLSDVKQYQARDAALKKSGLIYRNKVDINFEGFTVTTGQFAGDCMELNTENPTVYNYLIKSYDKYIDMGVDAFRIDTVKHVSRLTFNEKFIPAFQAEAKKNGNDNFYMFGEIATRVFETWNHNLPPVSSQFFTWKENKDYAWNNESADGLDNLASTKQEFDDNSDVSKQPVSKNHLLDGNKYHTPDHSQKSGLDVIDFTMHWNFENASKAFQAGKAEDSTFNDATYNVVYVDSHDYGPQVGSNDGQYRFGGGTAAWAENLDLMFTFRGIPCLLYGSEIEFQAGAKIDQWDAPLATTGRAYYGDNIEGSVTTTDYSKYSGATGAMKATLEKPLAKHIQRLNQIRRAIPALSKGQYSTEGCSGNISYKKRYTDSTTDSFALVTVSGASTFTGVPNGTYIDAITGDKKVVTNGTLTTGDVGASNMRVYVLDLPNGKAPGKIGEDGAYLK